MENIKVTREKDINVLFEIIDNRDFYKENSKNGLVILLNGAWGTGKTTFLNEFEEKINKSSKYSLFTNYNAYSFDFYDNAYLPFFASIEDKIELGSDFNRFINSTNRNIVSGVVSSAYSIANSIIKEKYKIDLNDIKDCMVGIQNEEYLKQFIDFKKCKEKIKEKLTKYCKTKPQIIIIDELDRCKPNFAIDTLEIIKHFMDVKNCMFVIAVDKLQLLESAKTIYGQGMDAEKYFSKFFDYQYNLLPLNFNEIVDTSDIIELKDILNRTSEVFNYLKVSSRDSKKIFSDFIYKYRKFSKNNNNWTSNQSIFIIFLLTLKYVDLLFYNEIINGNFKKYKEKLTNEINPMSNNYIKLLKIKIGNDSNFEFVCSRLTTELKTIYLENSIVDRSYIVKSDVLNLQIIAAKDLRNYIPHLVPGLTYRETIEKIIN